MPVKAVFHLMEDLRVDGRYHFGDAGIPQIVARIAQNGFDATVAINDMSIAVQHEYSIVKRVHHLIIKGFAIIGR